MKKLIILIIFFTSCVYDNLNTVAFVKNESNRNVIIIPMYDNDTVSDNILFYADKNFIKSKYTLKIVNNIGKLDKTHLFIFDADSVYKYIHLNIKSNIVSKAFLQKQDITYTSQQQDDTIYYK